MNRKKILIAALITIICCILMVVFPTTALYSARKGISLWLSNVLPALLPFFICANFLQNIGVISFLKSGVFPFAMSVLSGYPMGAKIVGDLRRQNEISLNEARRLMSFCSTSGPAFMISAVGAGMLGSGLAGSIIAIAHYAGAVINWFLYSRIFGVQSSMPSTVRINQQRGMQEQLTDAILASFRSLGIVLAYIVLFMFVTDLLNLIGILSLFESQEVRVLIKGFMEMTVGCGAVAECTDSPEFVKCILCTAIISWGGLSVMGQTMSMLSGTGITLKYLIVSKLTHSLFSAGTAFFIGMFVL